MDKETHELLKKIERLENEVEELKMPYRCEVCQTPTDGYVSVLFFKSYYCKKHYPYHMVDS